MIRELNYDSSIVAENPDLGGPTSFDANTPPGATRVAGAATA
jgi:hypothetical protein